jgi:hypothetical protein
MIRFLLIPAFILMSCNSGNKEMATAEKVQTADDLVGEWRNTTLRVITKSANGIQDSARVLEATLENWEERVRIKPIQTFFEKDGTYRSDHFSLNDSLLFSAIGTWTLSNDTLVMKQTSPNVATYRLKTSIVNDEVTFSGLIDFDDDGAEDDEYFGTQKKF